MIYLKNLKTGHETTIKSDTVIGRKDLRKQLRQHSTSSYLEINSVDISRLHAKITQINENYLIQDLHSTNGTFLNGKRLTPGVMYPLKDQDSINLGESGFQVTIPECCSSDENKPV